MCVLLFIKLSKPTEIIMKAINKQGNNGVQGREWNHHGVLGKGKHRGTCSSSFSEGCLAVSSKPTSPWSCLPPPALCKSISPTSFYSLAGRNLSLPKPQAWKLSSSRQLSVLKEYTDLTFLRSHRRLIS